MKHLINKAVLDAIVECGGSQKKLADKLGMNRSSLAFILSSFKGACPPQLRYKLKNAFPIIPHKEYEKTIEVESNQFRFCKKLIMEFLKNGRKK
jgi:hypothetical protein